MKKRLLFVALCTLLVLSCKTTEDPTDFEVSSLPGMIYDGDNRPCERVSLLVVKVLEGEEKELYTVQTDINGRFILPNLDRGDYRIIAGREGYETLETDISYTSRTEVLYLKMFSQDQLLVLAADSFDLGRFDKALAFLLRSEKIDDANPRHLYTHSVFLYDRGEYDKALESLKKISSSGFDFPWVDLLVGDIYQYHLEEPQKALEALKRFSTRIDDGDVKTRIKELENL